MAAQQLLDRVEKYKKIGDGRWVAVCPAHDDRSPSLHITEKDNGMTLIHCKAGCGANDVLDAVNLRYSDLYPEGDYSHSVRRRVSKDTEDSFVIELWEHDRSSGRLPTAEDKKRFREALRRSGKANGFVSEVLSQSAKPLPSDSTSNDISEELVAGLITESNYYLNKA
jgi:DNA primase